jgi:hypothetical protein
MAVRRAEVIVVTSDSRIKILEGTPSQSAGLGSPSQWHNLPVKVHLHSCMHVAAVGCCVRTPERPWQSLIQDLL